ncbi:ATP-dependent RNA helicase DRS1 [Fusarium tjaetaba]|uniref:RNA helicase n=1 Tax=Fusarium tjaetaba TaxID=1567544 RepID=A0A8H5RIU1_9HYPO|nr:ATP-dependent RNA helicase DRS1 [Fusarium tjaetaba]KAF5634164.1 ATP-dependent RNA helicase DRS1 [Fusarium tjaetaba]
MAPSQKRKPAQDDFIFTIDDNDDIPVEEEEVTVEPPKKKAKTSKKSKKSKRAASPEDDEEENGVEGIWGFNDDDDGAMDSEFEFGAEEAADLGTVEFEGWGFDGAKKGMAVEKKGVDLDEIIRRRREKKLGKSDPEETAGAEENEAMDVDLDDDDDEVLADDAFGMNVASDVEESGDEKDEDDEDESGEEDKDEEDDEEDDDAASDNDSVATPTGHPDDDASDDSDDEEDAEEEAKRKAFFAPEEEEASGKKNASSFQAMSLSRPILRGLATVGFSKPTPIQAKAIPIALMGKDLVGGAVTGSGKTGAFIVPILERLLYRPKKIPTTRVVVLTPTRELAIQCHAVATKLAAFTDIKFTLAVGGLSLKAQEVELKLRPDVIIATPGRFIDHMRNSASFNVDTVEIMVLDEADRMLEDGFADELNEILTTLPKSRQTMLFSATMTSTVDRLIKVGLNKPARVMVDSQKKTVTTLVQEFVRLRPGREEKRMGYLAHVCKNIYKERVIIFFRQKKEAHRARIIFGLLGLSCAELHGSMNQTQRISSVEDFRDGKVAYLLATDLASRGLDIKGVDTVINYEAPQSLEIYVHRVGRTARAGRKGTALTLASENDRKVVKAAVKAGKAQGAKIVSRQIEATEVDALQAQIDEMDDEIEEIMQEEKEEKQLAHVEMQVKKGENLIQHEAEIKGRPRRTWFESEHDKKQSKQAGKDELNGMREAMKKKTGKLSNKDKKRLDNKQLRAEGGGEWRKGKSSEADMKARHKEQAKSRAKGRAAKEGGKDAAPGKPKGKGRGGGKRR